MSSSFLISSPDGSTTRRPRQAATSSACGISYLLAGTGIRRAVRSLFASPVPEGTEDKRPLSLRCARTGYSRGMKVVIIILIVLALLVLAFLLFRALRTRRERVREERRVEAGQHRQVAARREQEADSAALAAAEQERRSEALAQQAQSAREQAERQRETADRQRETAQHYSAQADKVDPDADDPSRGDEPGNGPGRDPSDTPGARRMGDS